jgi:hypothetical protein
VKVSIAGAKVSIAGAKVFIADAKVSVVDVRPFIFLNKKIANHRDKYVSVSKVPLDPVATAPGSDTDGPSSYRAGCGGGIPICRTRAWKRESVRKLSNCGSTVNQIS